MSTTVDASRRDTRRQRNAFQRIRWAERFYTRQLRKIAKHIEDLVSATNLESPTALYTLQNLLNKYSELIDPWARWVAQSMIADVQQRDTRAWLRYARFMGIELRLQLETAPVGASLRELLEQQVALIKSLPLKAAQRVQEIATGHLYTGERWEVLAKEIAATGRVTRSRADLIARTETTRAASVLTQARAQQIGSPGYIWRTMRDQSVRHQHRKLEGTFHRWDDPPVIGPKGERGHPGEIYNCFPANTIVGLESGLRRLFRIFYDGPLVCLKAGGEVIEATPNHPMLTQRGWVPAAELDEFDNLVCMPRQDCGISDNQKDQRETTFGEIFSSLVGETCERVPSTAFNFHGDIINSDVDQIVVDGVLLDKWYVILFEKFYKFALTKADRVMLDIFTGCRDNIGFVSSSCGFRPEEVLFGSFVGGNDLVCESTVSQRDAVALQEALHACSRDTKSFGDFGGSDSSLVERDDFLSGEIQLLLTSRDSLTDAGIDTECSEFQTQDVSVAAYNSGGLDESFPSFYQLSRLQDKSFRNFSGHVYTMETWTGQYGVGSSRIQVKNCRCFPEPIIPEQFE